MDLCFHYFAVKTLAHAAGFEESAAQIIAEFSQYVDDYDLYDYRKYSNIPEKIKKAPYDLYIDRFFNPANFNPATTGFWTIDDYVTLLLDRSQKFTVSPFHFIPQNAAHIKKDAPVTPASLGDGSYISDILCEAQRTYRNAGDGKPKYWALMHIGMVLHTFADTFAHQLFSGYNAPCNVVTLSNVTNNITGKDETEDYRKSIIEWLELLKKIAPSVTPAIGHMMLSHVPDLSHLTWTMRYPNPNGNNDLTYSRSNSDEFIRCGKEIINFLRGCLDKPAIAPDEWTALSKSLNKGFLVDISNLNDEKSMVSKLEPHWAAVFADYSYNYDHSKLLNGACAQMSDQIQESNGSDRSAASMNDDFYQYNAYADELLIKLYGSQPRKTWYNETSAQTPRLRL